MNKDQILSEVIDELAAAGMYTELKRIANSMTAYVSSDELHHADKANYDKIINYLSN